MTLSTAAFAASKSLAGRAVHIKVHPRPLTVTESREILLVLEKYGEVIMFKNLKYEPHAPAPNSALAIFRHSEAAKKALSASPVQFVFGEAGNILEVDDSISLLAVERPTSFQRVAIEKTADLSTSQPSQDENSHNGQGLALAGDKMGTSPVDIGGVLDAPIEHAVEPRSTKNTPDSVAWGATFSTPEPAPASRTATMPSNPAPFPTHTSYVPSSSSSKACLSRVPPKPTMHATSSRLEPTTEPPTTRREVSLSISPSGLNHSLYITRQYYYGPWRPNTHSIPGEDLSRRASMQGLSDVRLNMREVPVRIRMKREQEKTVLERRGLRGIRELWLKGMRERGEGIRDWEARENVSKREWSSVTIEDRP